jgi:hypothetical protein
LNSYKSILFRISAANLKFNHACGAKQKARKSRDITERDTLQAYPATREPDQRYISPVGMDLDICDKANRFCFKNREASLVPASQGWRETFSLNDHCPHPSNRSPIEPHFTGLIESVNTRGAVRLFVVHASGKRCDLTFGCVRKRHETLTTILIKLSAS